MSVPVTWLALEIWDKFLRFLEPWSIPDLLFPMRLFRHGRMVPDADDFKGFLEYTTTDWWWKFNLKIKSEKLILSWENGTYPWSKWLLSLVSWAKDLLWFLFIAPLNLLLLSFAKNLFLVEFKTVLISKALGWNFCVTTRL